MKQLQSYGIKVKVIIKRFKTSYELLPFIFPIPSVPTTNSIPVQVEMRWMARRVMVVMSGCYCYTYL